MTADRSRFFRHRAIDPLRMRDELADWFATGPGAFMLESEQDSLDAHLSQTAGYRAMLLKAVPSGLNVDAGSQLHRFTIAPSPGEGAGALSDPDALPLPSDVVELAVLHHVLDYTDYPHEALKESSRVVQASGHLIVVGFNPWSFFGLWRLFGRLFSARAVWRCRCLSVAQVTDWLKLVGFEPEKISYGACRPPLKSPRLLKHWQFLDRLGARYHLPLGNFYVITARKMRLRPIRGRQQWLAQAIKPVKLASSTQSRKDEYRSDAKRSRDIHRRRLSR